MLAVSSTKSMPNCISQGETTRLIRSTSSGSWSRSSGSSFERIGTTSSTREAATTSAPISTSVTATSRGTR